MDKVEIGGFLKLFNRSGYVLDFSTNEFDTFCMNSVGVAPCQKYQLSKGKSLIAFCDEAPPKDVEKLLFDLLTYYEFNCIDKHGEAEYRPTYEKCKQVYERERASIQIETPAIVLVSRDYIREISTKAVKAIENGDYDNAITKARTLLEEVFIYVVEKKGATPSDKGDIKRLYAQVKELYQMHVTPDMDKRTKELLSGLEKILNSISEMRNKNSDAHGVGKNRIRIEEHHARLFVNAALMMADFILSVSSNST